MRRGDRFKQGEQGFTFIAVLAAMLLLALASQGVMTVLSAQAHRTREAESTRAIDIYARALKSYYDASPGTNKQYPEALEDLLLDKRQVTVRRHLRKLYADPLQPAALQNAWGLMRDPKGRIKAVYSTATKAAP